MLINGKTSSPVGAFGTQRWVKAFQDTFLPPGFDLDLVHLAEPAFSHLGPIRLKLILGEVPELPTEPISKIHEYTQLRQDPLRVPPNPRDKQGDVILPIRMDQWTLKTSFLMKKSRKWRSIAVEGVTLSHWSVGGEEVQNLFALTMLQSWFKEHKHKTHTCTHTRRQHLYSTWTSAVISRKTKQHC